MIEVLVQDMVRIRTGVRVEVEVSISNYPRSICQHMKSSVAREVRSIYDEYGVISITAKNSLQTAGHQSKFVTFVTHLW